MSAEYQQTEQAGCDNQGSCLHDGLALFAVQKQSRSGDSRRPIIRVWVRAAPHRRCLMLLTVLTVLPALQAHQTGWALAQVPKASPAWS
jgi:hypothetical protein